MSGPDALDIGQGVTQCSVALFFDQITRDHLNRLRYLDQRCSVFVAEMAVVAP